MSEIKPVSIKTAEQRFNEDCEAMNLICVDHINQVPYFRAEVAELRAALSSSEMKLEALRNEVEMMQTENAELKARSDSDNEINLQLNLKLMELEIANKQLGNYYMKVHEMYWNDTIFEWGHGNPVYTDEFVEMVNKL
jgi:predicted RNase H-like nuclease (RuvC/YqgF family)